MYPPSGTAPARSYVVSTRHGLHVRPAAQFRRLVLNYPGTIAVRCDDETCDGKDLMGLLMLGAGPGAEVQVQIIGPDAETLFEQLGRLFASRFGGL